MTSRTALIARAGIAALALVTMAGVATARDHGGGSNGGGDSWLRGELQNPQFIQPYGYAAPNRREYRPYYGYGYPYTPYGDPRLIVVRPYRGY
jgi:hypothetical protein